MPARVVSVAGDVAQLQLPDGSVANVNITLVPEVDVDQYVLFDRGVALKVIEAEEAEAILALYAELVELGNDHSRPDGSFPPGSELPGAHVRQDVQPNLNADC